MSESGAINMAENQAKASGDSVLIRLMRTWERVSSWGEQELFLQFGDALSSLGRYQVARTFHSNVFPPGSPEEYVLIPKSEYDQLIGNDADVPPSSAEPDSDVN